MTIMGRIFRQNLHEYPGGFRGGVEPLDEAGTRFFSRVQQEPADEFITGQTKSTEAGVPIPLVTGEAPPVRRVIIAPLMSNTGETRICCAGGTWDSAFPLDEPLTLFVSDLPSIYVVTEIAGEGVAYIAEVALEAHE